MITIANAQLWVHDQDEALAFYTEQGRAWRSAATSPSPEMGNFRWLTVGPEGPARRRDRADGDPRPADDGRRDHPQVRDLMAKGFAGTVFLATHDCQASYEELSGRGVEFIDKPFETPYGIDSSFRDPVRQPASV